MCLSLLEIGDGLLMVVLFGVLNLDRNFASACGLVFYAMGNFGLLLLLVFPLCGVLMLGFWGLVA